MKTDDMTVLDCNNLFCVLPLNQINMVKKKDNDLWIDLEPGHRIHFTSGDHAEINQAYEALRKRIVDYYNPPSLWQKFLRLIRRK